MSSVVPRPCAKTPQDAATHVRAARTVQISEANIICWTLHVLDWGSSRSLLDHATLLSMMSRLRDTGSLAVAVIMGHETMNEGCRVQPGPKSEKL